jgi:hypothetical protein
MARGLDNKMPEHFKPYTILKTAQKIIDFQLSSHADKKANIKESKRNVRVLV